MLFVLIDSIRSAYNVGSIFRTADGAGVSGIFITGFSAYPPHKKIQKTSLGAENSVPWVYERDPMKLIEAWQKGFLKPDISSHWPYLDNDWSTYNLVAAETTDEAISLYDYNFPQNTILVLGHEVTGVQKEILDASAQTVAIPMLGHKISLNVAASFAVLAYDYYRQYQSL